MKKKILTVTLNPAVDKTYTVKTLAAGQVNRIDTVTNIAGGKGVNVTKILRQYGYEVAATGFLGGYSGRFIAEDLEKKGAECCFVPIGEETRSNMNIIADDGFVTEILEPGPTVQPAELDCFMSRYRELLHECILVVLSGSAAKGIQPDIYGRLIEIAATVQVPVFLDSSGESLRLGIQAKPMLVKPNWKELEYVMGCSLKDRNAVIEAAKRLHDEGIPRVVVSMGSDGLLSVADSGIYFAKAEGIEAVNTVGCGDSVVAAYAMATVDGASEKEAICRACAISAANAETLESASIPMETAETLLHKIHIEEISFV
jgi:tagatose 6-phosphate kinase